MDGDLDQLWYTWTTRGLDSGRGFQVRAASARFLDKRDRALSAALRYCYRPSGERAYGWIERDGHRIVFNRVDAGRHSVSSGSNFFVHLILGSREDLPTNSLWSLYDAPFWRTRDPGGKDLELPVLRADECGLVRGESDVGDRLPGFLAFLLHCIERRSGMQVPFAPDIAARLSSAAAAALPDEFGLVSFSTGENSSNAREYDVVCSDDRLPSFRSYTGPDDAADLPTMAAARTLLDTSAASRTLVETIATGPRERREFVRNLVTAVTYREGGDVSTHEVVDLVSARPEALDAMLDRRGMDNFAGQLARGDHTALAVVPRLRENQKRRAAKRVARAFAANPAKSLGLLRTTVRNSPSFTRETAREVLDRAHGDGRLSGLGWADKVEFVRILADSGAKLTSLVEQLLANERAAVGVATHGGLPTEWRVAAALRVPAAFSDGRFDRALTEDVVFAQQYLKNRRDEPIGTYVERIAVQLEPTPAWKWLQAVEPYVGPQNTEQARWDAIDRTTSPDEVLGRLYEQSRGWPTLASADWEDRLRDGLVASIRGTVRSPARRSFRPWTKELDMLDRLRPRSAEATAWTEILRCSDLLVRDGPSGQRVQALTRHVRDLHGEQRQAAARLALERTCYAASDSITFSVLTQDLRRLFGNVDDVDWIHTVVYTAARMPNGPPGDRASGIVGLWALDSLQALGYRPRRGTEMHAELEAIADRMSGAGQERLRRSIGSLTERLGFGVKRRNRAR